MANAGIPDEVRQKLTGHASPTVHKKYTHFELQPLNSFFCDCSSARRERYKSRLGRWISRIPQAARQR